MLFWHFPQRRHFTPPRIPKRNGAVSKFTKNLHPEARYLAHARSAVDWVCGLVCDFGCCLPGQLQELAVWRLPDLAGLCPMLSLEIICIRRNMRLSITGFLTAE